jgi:hypothetical protein
MAVASGLLTLVGTIAIFGGSTESGSLVLFAVVAILFGLSLAGTIGVARRSAWARVVAIIAGFAVSLTCIGLLFGIPILVSAFTAPNLTRSPAPAYPMPTP